MYHSPDRALSEIQVIGASVQRAEGMLGLHDISRGLAYRAGMMKRESQNTVAPFCCGSPHVDRFISRLYSRKGEGRSWLMFVFLHRILSHEVIVYKYGFSIDGTRATIANNL